MSLTVTLVPCLKDNYAYLLADRDAGLCAVVDPSEPGPVKAALAKSGLKLTHILNTHHHWDHTGGNEALKAEFGARVVGPGKDRDRIPGIDEGVSEDTGWTFGPHRARILEVPAHTKGAITFVFGDIAFTGQVDRNYLNTQHALTIIDPSLKRKIQIEKTNSSTTVVWNPGPARAKTIVDLGENDWPNMLCVETANLAESEISLPAGAIHSMKSKISVEPLAEKQ